MILRLLRYILRLLTRISNISWTGNDSRTPYFQFIHRFFSVLKFLKSRLTSNACSGILYRQCDRRGGSFGHKTPGCNCYRGGGGCEPMSRERSIRPSNEVVSFSWDPSSFVNRISTPPGITETSGSSEDAGSLRSVQIPQSPASTHSAGGEIHVVGPDSPRTPVRDWGTEDNEIPDENRLGAPPRRSARSTSPSPRARSNSPGSRSSAVLRPISSYASFQPQYPSKLGTSRPQTPSLLHAPSAPHSLRPSSSRLSVRSYFSVRPDHPPSIVLPEPEPLPIIEPAELPEPFDDPSGRIWTLAPEMIYRYDKKIFVTKNAGEITLEPMTMRFEAPWNPEGWNPIIHPEGQLYFWHEEKRVITEAYLYDKDVFYQLHKYLEKIETFVARVRLYNILGKHDLVLDLMPHESSGYYCGYYFVNHEERSIFWLQPYPASYLADWKPQEGHKSKLHLKHAIEAQYWYHCQMFPTTLTLKIELVAELRDILLHAIVDTMTSITSTAPYTHEELNKMLGWVNSLKKNLDIASLGSGSLVARLMYIFVRERFLHYYGEPTVRLARGASVYGTIHRRTLLIRILSPILFSAPLQHLMALERIWVDEIVHEPTWKILINKFNKQWEEFILFATVMLNANMALLAIQSVDSSKAPSRSPTQIASYLSVVASTGSIIIGLLLIKMNRVRLTETAPDALRFIDGHQSKFLGLETLAILYSLPFALLMWGMIAFLVAFCFICFQNTTPAVQGIIGSACILTGFLVAWCILVGWDKNIHLQPKAIEQTIVKSEEEDDNEDAGEKHDVAEQVDNDPPQPRSQGDHMTQEHLVHNPDIVGGTGHRRPSSPSDRWKKSWSGLLNLELRSKLPRNLRPSQESETTAVAV